MLISSDCSNYLRIIQLGLIDTKPFRKVVWIPREWAEELDAMADKQGLTGKARYGDMARIIIKRAMTEGAQ